MKTKAVKLSNNERRRWEKWEDNYLHRHYHDRKIESISKVLKRTKSAILSRAYNLKLTESNFVKWTEEEKNKLRQLYPDRQYTIEQMVKMLGRPRYGILQQAYILKLHRPRPQHEWTEEETKYLAENYLTKSASEMAEDLGMTVSAVTHKIGRSGLKVREKGRSWSEEEKEYVKQNYKKIPTKDLAQRLNRTVNSIITIVGNLGVSESRPLSWSLEEKDFIIKNYGHLSIEEISKALRRSRNAIVAVASKFKLTNKKSTL